ncbi:hypothetical protein Goari_026739 [Gossypium aridum]|uniref:Uncharacterized protein n=1 Tax=Gossypium aridum TaxID=34290 RepID=A0A7J8XDH6_GOSAI|nr:hypothetical protein [Gossypium aridum]
MTAMPPNSQSAYPTSSLGYSSYYNAVPPPPPPPLPTSSTDNSQSLSNVPWAPNPLLTPAASSGEKTTYGADTEYEKFMAEMNAVMGYDIVWTSQYLHISYGKMPSAFGTDVSWSSCEPDFLPLAMTLLEVWDSHL